MNRKLTGVLVSGLTAATVLTGCGSGQANEIAPIEKEAYEKVAYETVPVYKGEFQPILSIPLTQNAYENVSYSLEIDDLEVKEVFVESGDMVKEGDVMVVFRSEEIEKSVKEQRENVDTLKLLLEHVKKLRDIETDDSTLQSNLDKKEEYDYQISKLQDDIRVGELFLAEQQTKLDSCTIKAKKDGVITYLNKGLKSGVCSKGATVITESCGELKFYAVANEDYDFHIGDTFEAESPAITCKVIITDITDDGRDRVLYFEPLDTQIGYVTGQKFYITIEKETMKDVVYVDTSALYENDEKQKFVFVLSEDGYRDVVFVDVDCVINNVAIIKKGLKGGEEVIVR